MKSTSKITLILILAWSAQSSFAQDSIVKSRLLFRPFFENGVGFIQNDLLKTNYKTQSVYFWGIGLQAGHLKNNKIIPYVQFSYSSFTIRTKISETVYADSLLQSKQFIGGFLIKLKEIDNLYLRAKLAYNYSMIKESFNNIDENSNGFLFGLGAERKILNNSRLYVELVYNFQKTSASTFSDFDMTRLSLGIVF